MKPLLERRTIKEILELSDHPTIDEVKRNYKRLVKLYHPDINKRPEAEECIKRINQAYDICIKKRPISQQPQPERRSPIIFTVHVYYGTNYFYSGTGTTGTETW